MLLDLKQYLVKQDVINLFELTQRFAITTEVARELLSVWQQKGKVERVVASACASKCSKCSPGGMERYRWIG